MTLPVRKGYRGAPAQAVLTNSPTSSDTSFIVDTVVGWATTFPFYCVVDPGKSTEEKVKVTAISGVALTVVRNQDDTSPSGHNAGAVIYPVFTADEADEANQVASAMTTKGDLIATDGSTINRLGVGTDAHVLQADSASTNGVKWGQVVAGNIATGAVTSDKILNNTIVLGDLATALQAFLVPVGSINAYAGATAPAGWLLCNGTSTTGYTALAALVGATTPDLQGKFALGKTASGTGSTLLGTGGTNTIGETHLPAHAHSVGTLAIASNTTGITTVAVGNHNHTLTDPAHSHTVNGEEADTWAIGDSLTGVLESAFNTGAYTEATAAASTNISIAEAGAHSHTITDPGHGHTISGATANKGDGTAYFQPFLAVNYIIKHD